MDNPLNFSNDHESLAQEFFTILDLIRWANSEFNRHQIFYGHGTTEAWDEAVFLVLGALDLPWNSDGEILSARLSLQERKHVLKLINQRTKERIPAPYLIGEAWFCGLPFFVNPDVLIPRSPIAELIEQSFEPWLTTEPDRILDLCTGSGCIGIACAAQFGQSEVDLVDISRAALDVADSNVSRYDLGSRANSIESDLFAALPAEHQYDLIVSNPPYVDAEDFDDMPAEFSHEPELGLVSGDDGLNATRIILKEAASYLTDQGILIVEVGNSAAALQNAYPNVPFTWIEFERGGHGVFLLTRSQLDQAEHLF